MISVARHRILPLGVLLSLIALMLLGSVIQHMPASDKDKERAAQSTSPSIYALVHVGKPPKGWDCDFYPTDCYRRLHRDAFTRGETLCEVRFDPEFTKLKVVKEQKDLLAWLRKNIRAEYFDNTPILRIWWAAGSPDEQVAIINAFMRVHQRQVEKRRKDLAEQIAVFQSGIHQEGQRLIQAEAKLLALNNVVPGDEKEGMILSLQRNRLAEEFARLKESVAAGPRRTEEIKAKFLLLPRLVQWAEKPEPAG